MSAFKRQDLMLELSKDITRSDNPIEELFCDKKDLLGFSISWLKDELFENYCKKYDLDSNDTEIILMQAQGRTDCHLHQKGLSVFRTLGPEQGFSVPDGGILTAMYQPGKDTYDLEEVTFEPGEFSIVAPYQIHAFYAKEGTTLTALGVVSPRIRSKEDDFDVLDFTYEGETSVKSAFC